jgi:exodeoxyribonuclease VII large subunit
MQENKDLKKFKQDLFYNVELKGDKSFFYLKMHLSDTSALARKYTLQALAKLSFSLIEDEVILMLQDSAESVRKEAIKVLVEGKSQKALPILQGIADDPNQKDTIRSSAKIGIKVINGQSLNDGEEQKEKVLSVYEFNNYINEILSFEEVKVEGEISSFQMSSHMANQWVFFDLKDETKEAKIRCFSNVFMLRKSRISPVDGMRVIVTGKPRLSVKSGMFSIQVSFMEVSGEGELMKAYLLLKEKLEREGLFALERKRPLPYLPSKIGLITSRDAAAFRDFTKVLRERMGGMEIYFRHCQVQGAKAVDTILEAIYELNTYPDIEVIVLTRGGGSMDDLHAFNDESVARAIFSSRIPIIAGVGHERDETIAEFVADKRASTPSNAAEILAPHRSEVLEKVNGLVIRSEHILSQKVREYRQTLDAGIYVMENFLVGVKQQARESVLSLKYQFGDYIRNFEQTKLDVARMRQDLERMMEESLRLQKDRLGSMTRVLVGFDHKKVLHRGFSLTRVKGKVLRSVDEVKLGDVIETELADGKIETIYQKLQQKSLF